MSEKRKFNIVSCETKELQGGKKLYNCVGSDGVKYACWEGKVLEFVQKGEREFNVFSKQNGEYTNWYIDLKEPGQGGGGGFGKRPFTPSFRDSKDGIVLSSKTMVLSYCKDITAALVNSAQLKKEEVWAFTLAGFTYLLPALELDKIKEPTVAPPANAQGHVSGQSEQHSHSPLSVMLLEISVLKTMPAFSNWWNSHTTQIKALTPGDRQILIAEKAKKIEELEHNQEVYDSDIPF